MNLTLALALFALTTGIQQEPLNVRLKFDPARVDKITLITDLAQTFYGADLPEPMRQTEQQTMHAIGSFQVLSGGEFVWNFQIRNIARRSDIEPVPEVDFESLGEMPGLPGEIIRTIRDNKFSFTFDKDGKLVRLSGFEELFKKFEALGAPASVLERMKEEYDPGEMQRLLASGLASLITSAPVPVGGSWRSTMPLVTKELGEMSFEVVYTFNGYEVRDGRRQARITVRSSGKQVKKPEPVDGVVLMVKNMAEVGYLYFDIEAGWVAEQVATLTMDFEMTDSSKGAPVTLTGKQRLKSKTFVKFGKGGAITFQ